MSGARVRHVVIASEAKQSSSWSDIKAGLLRRGRSRNDGFYPGLKGIDRVSRRGGTDIGFEAVAVHHVDGTINQARDVILEASIVEHGEMRLRIDLDHDVDVAAGTAVAARHRAEHSRTANGARAEITFGSTQGFKGFATVHEARHSTKSRSAGEIGALRLSRTLEASEDLCGRAALQHLGDAEVFVQFGQVNAHRHQLKAPARHGTGIPAAVDTT